MRIRLMMSIYKTGLRLLSHLGRTLLLGVAILLGCKEVQEVGL